MQIKISKKSMAGFKAAAKKLSLSPELPDFTGVREDLALWLQAKYMLAVIIEAGKDGKLHDITNHSVTKYEPVHYAENGYVPGSSGGGFSYCDFGGGYGRSAVGARLSFNSPKECRENAEAYPDLWEIVTLNVR